MTLTITIPQEIEAQVQGRAVDLDSVAREALFVELYRLGEITHCQLCSALGLSRYEADGVLKRHHIYYDLTEEELKQQITDVIGERDK